MNFSKTMTYACLGTGLGFYFTCFASSHDYIQSNATFAIFLIASAIFNLERISDE